MSAWTVRQVVDRVVELGIVDAATAERELLGGAIDKSLDFYGAPDAHAVVHLLGDLGISYSFDYDTYRYLHEEGVGLFVPELRLIEKAGGGRFALTDITLGDEVGEHGEEHVLRFRCNGEPITWRFTHDEDEDEENWDISMTVALSLGDIGAAGSPARWCEPKATDGSNPTDGLDLWAAFADPDALNRLGADFGLMFDYRSSAC